MLHGLLLYSQNRAIDAESGDGLPFCTIVSKHNPDIYTVSDINGNFNLAHTVAGDTIIIRYIGYDTLEAIFLPNKEYRLYPATSILKEAVIIADDGPAIALIKKVLKRRNDHNILNLDYYQCRIYSRNTIGFDTSADSLDIKQFGEIFRYPASLFISESIIERQYERKQKMYEKVITSKMSGLRDEKFVILPEDVQSLNFYRDYISIFNKDFVNPISPLSWLKYHFNLDKVYEEANDTLYKIDYWPRNSGYNCFKGMIIISANDWAVQKITMKNTFMDLYPFVLYQEYWRVNNQWFPYKFITEVKLPSAFGKEHPFLVKQTNIFDKITFLPIPIEPSKINKTEYQTGALPSIDSMRMMPLNRQDSTAYVFGDVLLRSGPSGYILQNMQLILNGQLPIGPLAIDMLSIYRKNLFEGNRFGLSVHSSMKLMPHLGLEAYFAYGTHDNALKYGGSVAWYFDKLRTSNIKYTWNKDVEGNRLFRFRNQWFNQYYSNLFVELDKHEFSYFKTSASHSIKLATTRETIDPYFEYDFKGINPGESGEYINSEISASYQYIKGRQINFFNTYFIVRNPSYPIFNVSVKSGLKGIAGGNFSYGAIEANFNKIFRWAIIGNTSLTIQGGFIMGRPPIFKLFNAPGARILSMTISTPYSLQTMPPNHYFSTRYLHIFLQQTIRRLYATKFSAPELFVSYNAGWGRLDNMSDHSGVTLKDYHDVFQEVGLGLNSCIRIPIADWFAFGINAGAYYNLNGGLPLEFGKNYNIKAGFGFLF